MKDLAIIVKTFEREKSFFEFIASAEKSLPQSRLYIADDSLKFSQEKKALYKRLKANGHVIVRMPYDSGLPAGRNACLDKVKEKYILLCDDDFILHKGIKVQEAAKSLTGDIGIACGSLEQNGRIQHYELLLGIKDRVVYKNPVTLKMIDAGLNFFVAKREVFDDVRWDNRFIISGEHLDFFLALKKTKWKVLYFPELTAIHKQCREDPDYVAKRSRKSHWGMFADKWDLDGIREEDGSYFDYMPLKAKKPVEVLFRDDDVSVDSNLTQIKAIENVLNKYNKRYLPSVVPFGKTTPLYDNYSDGLSRAQAEEMLGWAPITDNKEVCEYLKGKSVCMHGFNHWKLPYYDNNTKREWIAKGKALLEKVTGVPVMYFAAPFNYFDPGSRAIIAELGMKILGSEGDHLETLVKTGGKYQTSFVWFHHWRFFRDGLTVEMLDEYLKNNG